MSASDREGARRDMRDVGVAPAVSAKQVQRDRELVLELMLLPPWCKGQG